VFDQAFNLLDDNYTGDVYYANHDDGLFFYGNSGSWIGIPKSSNEYKFNFNGIEFNRLEEIAVYLNGDKNEFKLNMDTIFLKLPPLLNLRYPLEIGERWIYFTPGDNNPSEKEILSFENVTVPAGTFDCYKIQHFFDINDDGEWDDDFFHYDYVSEKGLIKRSILLKDLLITDQNGDSLGLMDYREEYFLTEFEIVN
jgi:hypothetical protein